MFPNGNNGRKKQRKRHILKGKTELSASAQHISDRGRTILESQNPRKGAANNIARKVQEALLIHKLDKKTMNQDKGMDLSNLWLDVLDTEQQLQFHILLFQPHLDT